VPIAIACALVKAAGRCTSQSAARVFGVAFVVALAASPAVEDHGITGRKLRMRGGGHRAGEVDAGNERQAHARKPAGQREPILVVDGRVRDAHGHIAVHEVAFAQRRPCGAHCAIATRQHQSFEVIHAQLRGEILVLSSSTSLSRTAAAKNQQRRPTQIAETKFVWCVFARTARS
jgi:hypothetical protein